MSSINWPPVPGGGGGGGGVTSLNSLTGDLNLIAGSGISITPSGSTLSIAITGAGAGSVTSVALSAPAMFSVSGSPITTSGTLALSLATQAQNLVFIGPVSGSAAAPTFRALNLLDLPPMATQTILGNNTGGTTTPSSLTATQVTAMLNPFTSSLNGLAPASGGGTNNFLRADGSWVVPPTSSGGITGNYYNGLFVTGSWTVPSSFGDLTTPSGLSYTRRTGTLSVAQASGSICGVTFTPSSASAVYLVTVLASLNGQTDTVGLGVYAGNLSTSFTQIAASNTLGPSSLAVGYTVAMTGIFAPGTASPVSIKIMGITNTGSVFVRNQSSGLSGLTSAAEFTIVQIA